MSSSNLPLEAARWAAARFRLGGNPVEVSPLGRGLINDTFLVRTDAPADSRVILQRLNREVFPAPCGIMANLRVLVEHVSRLRARQPLPEGDIQLPRVYNTLDGGDCLADRRGDSWRALGFIENSINLDRLDDPRQAYQVGFCLGRFHALTHDLPAEHMLDTLPGFHIAPGYLRELDLLAMSGGVASAPDVALWLDFIDGQREAIGVLEQAKAAGDLMERVMHGDPKLDNVLFHRETGSALALVDLDTVKPGLIHYDIGDCARSCCARYSGSQVGFDLGLCEALLAGYVDQTRHLLTAADYELLYAAIRLIPLELGIRFLTDHLRGNRYFKVRYSGQNLEKAADRFRLTADIERQERALRRLIQGLLH